MAQLPPPVVQTTYGYSYLDTVLHARASGNEVVSNTFSRLLYMGKLASAAGGGGGGKGGGGAAAAAASLSACTAELTDLHERSLSAEVSGLLVVQPLSFWALVEGPPECMAALVRALVADSQRPGSRVQPGAVRVVANVEDVTSSAFRGFFARKYTPPPEGMGAAAVAAETEDAHPVSAAGPVYRALVDMGQAVLEAAGEGDTQQLLAALEEKHAAALPSDERVQALAAATKVGARALRGGKKKPPPTHTLNLTHPLPTHPRSFLRFQSGSASSRAGLILSSLCKHTKTFFFHSHT